MTDDSRWVTVVVRAWSDAGGVRARLLRTGSEGGDDHRVVASIDDAVATVGTWLRTLDDGESDPATGAAQRHRDAGTAERHRAAGTERRRTVRRDTDAADDGCTEGG